MSAPLKYETPENVQIEYHPAGMGTRFVAWFVDWIILDLLIILAFIGLLFVSAISEGILHDFFKNLEEMVNPNNENADPEKLGMFILGIAVLIWGFSSLFYYGFSELLWRGQTLGKRACRIRVVKADGFALDTVSIFVRNIFRAVDNLPPLWIVPVLSRRGQRCGDMVGGTIVVSDEAEDLPEIREELSRRNPAEAKFRFDRAKLSRLTRDDFDTVERILDRWNALAAGQKVSLLDRIVVPLCKKMQSETPGEDQRIEFLDDLLAAEYRRQDRHL